MFELIDDEPPKRENALQFIARVLFTVMLLALAWVIFGAAMKVCARLFFLGWDLV